ncbi:MAG TPA: ABC transporter permease [Candidatus Acidoferrum sp.]|nr:ABC transporter permease [Candidatus Acidoferrum sp.]
MGTIGQDIRYGLRMLVKNRLTTLVCVAALALGIGANTAMFSVAEAFLLRPVPFDNSNRIVALVDSRPSQGIDTNSIAPATYLEWKAQARSFDEMGAYVWNSINLTGDREAEKAQGFAISANFFDVLGVHPLMGRAFLPEEEQVGKDQVIILSYGLWERRYASDPHILGKKLKVDGKAFEIVGVMSKGFDFPKPAEAWVPLTFNAEQRMIRDARYLWVLAHLKPQVSTVQAAAEMRTIAARQAEAFPDAYKGWQVRVLTVPDFATGTLTRQYTFLLLGAVGFVLLIACADVANVQFARVTGRHKELAVRTAMGASRSRIIRQLLTESVLLSLAGAALGWLIAEWWIFLMVNHMPPEVGRFIAGWNTISLDRNAFLFTLAVAIASGIVSGIAPSWLHSQTNISETLKESGRGASTGRSRHRLRSALVIAEIALALILLVGAGLLVKGFRALIVVHENFRPASVLTLSLDLPETQYKDKPGRAAFHEQVLQRLAAIPHVQSAALATYVPYANGGGTGVSPFAIEGRAPEERGVTTSAIVETISPNYFRLMNIGLRDGRELTDSDSDGTPPVAVISKNMAKRYFPGENPLGKKLKIGKADANDPWMTIVGIVDDVHYTWVDKQEYPTIYRSYRQAPPFYNSLVLRTNGDPVMFIPAVRSAVAAVDPNLPLFDVLPFDKVITNSIVGIAYVAAMMAILGFIALVLASVGIYGVMSYSVGERTHEIGVRMAMGATSNDVQKLILRNGLFLTIIGMAIGLPLALGLAYAVSSLLFGVTAADPFAFVGLPLLLAAVAALACYLPARRAVRMDPLAALRYE